MSAQIKIGRTKETYPIPHIFSLCRKQNRTHKRSRCVCDGSEGDDTFRDKEGKEEVGRGEGE